MSMDAGGLAQMTYSDLPSGGALAVPGSGFASRGKGSHIKRLSMPPPAPQTSAVVDDGVNRAPRTSRSHLLAGLRTAPKTPGVPPSAPPTQLHHRNGLDSGHQLGYENSRPVPKTATASSFPLHMSNAMSFNPANAGRQMYSLPEQVLAPPAIQLSDDPAEEQMDPQLYAELYATNLYLAQQQQRLQQQLINVTAAAQQFQGLGLNGQANLMAEQQNLTSPVSPTMGFFPGDGQAGMLNGYASLNGLQPGTYQMYSTANGQTAYQVEPGMQQVNYYAGVPTSGAPVSSAQTTTSQFRTLTSPSALVGPNSPGLPRGNSPPKPAASPSQATPSLPPPSANAFRRGHKKATSLASCVNSNLGAQGKDGAPQGVPKSAGFPQTPMTGTFGPGQGRAGEHPIRQPRGPPPLEELIANPTSKHDGSKNFVTRQRRRAVHSLVRAGMERRGGRSSGSPGSAGSMTPASETEIAFSVTSDESDSAGSAGLSRRPSLGSILAAANGAIGSERRELKDHPRERGSIGSDDEMLAGHGPVEIKADSPDGNACEDRRRTAMLVLNSAAKRKSTMF